ncbi:glutamate-gated chloride channel-like [Penaeus japonicus]|uniref:glutamate-gated chloride channel-like n=1 Tax=Penaeus japonicus TaxID=27405 RepID=UPI001C712692|nr:glutamate-gated chloride channel-like [Penaeus japonicus]
MNAWPPQASYPCDAVHLAEAFRHSTDVKLMSSGLAATPGGPRQRGEQECGGQPDRYKYQGAENPLVLELDLMSTVNCQFLLQLYPWDEQKCQVAITGLYFAHFAKKQMTNVSPDGVNVSHDSQVVQCPSLLEQYHVKECSLRKGSLTVSLRLSRRYEYHLWTTYLPTCLLQLLGYWSLYLPVNKFSERGTMSLTTLLVLISLYTDTNSSLPSTAYLKHIDVWFVFNICFLTLIIGIHLATCSSVSEGTAADTQSVGILFSSPGKDSDERSKYRKALTDPAFVLRVSRVVCAAVTIAFSVVYFWMIC